MPMFALAAVLLSVERIFYIHVSRRPDSLTPAAEALSARGIAADRVDVLRWAFYGLKVLQLVVFAGWCVAFSEGREWTPPTPAVLAAAATLVGVGQFLNVSVFYRLGVVGVFYGVHFGYAVPWTRAFPFSYAWLKHPQYVGTVLSIWGVFLAARYPHPDWWALPLLESAYYSLGARLEK
jgi:methylene-fatty-acyl-phospholipid synthase